MTPNTITANLLRQALTEWMRDTHRSIDLTAHMLNTNATALRRWLLDQDNSGMYAAIMELRVDRLLIEYPSTPAPKPEPTGRYCTKCGFTLPLTSFAPAGNGRLRSWCRDCANEHSRVVRVGLNRNQVSA